MIGTRNSYMKNNFTFHEYSLSIELYYTYHEYDI